MRSNDNSINVRFVDRDHAIADLDNAAWTLADAVTVDDYWSGERAPNGRHFIARMLWSETALYVRFDAHQEEPLVVNDKPDLSQKTIGLWERDVCEIFIAPDQTDPDRYFEFEVAPTGEWLDLAIVADTNGRDTDWDYISGMTSAADIRGDSVIMAIKIPWAGFGNRPVANDVWLGNIFRCVGNGKTRGYLAWSATGTAIPNFHVTASFTEIRFVSR